MSKIIEHVRMMHSLGVESQSNFLEFFIENAETFTERTNMETKSMLMVARKNKCFVNSLLVNIRDNNYQYCEGYYMVKKIPFPLEHAFNVKDGKLYDNTVEKYKLPITEWAGVLVPQEVALEFALSEESKYISLLRYFHRYHVQK